MTDPRNRPRAPRRAGGSRRPSSNRPRFSGLSKSLALWLLIILLPLTIYQLFMPKEQASVDINYSEFVAQLEADNVDSVTITDLQIRGKLEKAAQTSTQQGLRSYSEFRTVLPFEDPDLVRSMQERGVSVEAREPPINWFTQVVAWLPWILIIGLWIFFIRQIQGGGSKAFSFGKSKAKLLSADAPKVTFDDVAGADEAKEELEEIIEFLRDPKKFQRLGGRIPKGVLLLGPPGTGKTLLARAVAGEAGVPFFSMSGSDFVEMFVGVGASRVRDLFEQGKAHAPCIIFIDEIDAVGRHRGAGLGGGHDEREQTLNQLLVEMDGFESNEGVILIAATNRPDVLDPALLRPGRFDRQVVVDRPDVRGREGIFEVHVRDIPIASDVDLKVLAKGTPGLSGADIENIVNEAALLAARRNHTEVTMDDFEMAKDKVMMGAERKSLVITENEKRSIAYHEAGHALVRMLTPAADPVHKVTIIPRGRALGVTHFLPVDERHIYSREWCENQLSALLGGRAAEVLVLKETTTGAGDDLQRATDLARRMVTKWGMSEVLGPLTYGDEQEQVFLGREIAQHRDYSEETARLIDSEVKKIVTSAFERACSILERNDAALHRLAEALLEREILDREEIALVLAGEKLPSLDEEPASDKGEARREGVASPATAGVDADVERGALVPEAVVGTPLAEVADRGNGRRAGEPASPAQPAARAEDGAPGEA
ncbi:MAG TPA: ATP-dependent zinc metalloprotease FtsH [Gemmatimonadota bacterium]|nr:ATP-dependent zinc metalloprotease FtsH [Gemmatimonadota bacterium]